MAGMRQEKRERTGRDEKDEEEVSKRKANSTNSWKPTANSNKGLNGHMLKKTGLP